MKRHSYRWMTVAAAATTIAASGLVAAPAAAAPDAAPAASGWVRFGHFAPAAAPVDLYVDGAQVAGDIGYKTVSPYIAVPAGSTSPPGLGDGLPVGGGGTPVELLLMVSSASSSLAWSSSSAIRSARASSSSTASAMR